MTDRAQSNRTRPQPAPGTPAGVAGHQLAVATEWLSRGYPVIPLHRVKKRPLVGGFSRDATPEQLAPFYSAAQVQDWWTGRYKRAHVGLLTGRGAGRGLVVIDLDVRKPNEEITGRFADAQHGTEVLHALMADATGQLPPTYEVSTPSGGRHLYYQQPDGEPLGCTTRRVAPLIDTRGHGGLVVAPGSYSSAQGGPYTRTSTPGLPPQPLPHWILQLLRPPVTQPVPSGARGRLPVPQTGPRAERYAAAALNALAADVAAATKGDRWRTLTAAAFRLAELSTTAPNILHQTAVTNTLVTAAGAAGTNPREAERIVRGAWTKAHRGVSA